MFENPWSIGKMGLHASISIILQYKKKEVVLNNASFKDASKMNDFCHSFMKILLNQLYGIILSFIIVNFFIINYFFKKYSKKRTQTLNTYILSNVLTQVKNIKFYEPIFRLKIDILGLARSIFSLLINKISHIINFYLSSCHVNDINIIRHAKIYKLGLLGIFTQITPDQLFCQNLIIIFHYISQKQVLD